MIYYSETDDEFYAKYFSNRITYLDSLKYPIKKFIEGLNISCMEKRALKLSVDLYFNN